MATSSSQAAIVWDGEAGTHWWFDPVNWNAASNANTVLPPSNNAMGTSASDTQINNGISVVYDPANDPFFDDAGSLPFPTSFGRQTINHLYMSVNTVSSNQLTIRGDLTFRELINIGRSSGTRGVGVDAIVIQESGTVTQTVRELDLGQVDTANLGYGNGTWEYKSGILNIGTTGGNGLRLSNGSNNNTVDGSKAGPGGIGKFIVHNPSTPGFVRVRSINSSAFAGFAEGIQPDGSDSTFDPLCDPNGETTGVAIWEFHYDNGGTRAIQVRQGMVLNNGVSQQTRGIRSSRLDFVLDSPACFGLGCIPNNVGLFDLNYDGGNFGLTGEGDINNDGVYTDRYFSNIDNTATYPEGSIVSAVYGGVQYNWTISYTGRINWANSSTSTISSITGPGTGEDIVLMGHSSTAAGLAGDFDGDGDVDGRDFLIWQRGETNPALDPLALAAWQNAYVNQPLSNFETVPEPSSLIVLCVLGLSLAICRRKTV